MRICEYFRMKNMFGKYKKELCFDIAKHKLLNRLDICDRELGDDPDKGFLMQGSEQSDDR